MNSLALVAEAGGGPVEQIARTFGVDWPQLIAQTISFCIVCALLYRFAYRPVLRILERRQKLIAQGLADAQQSKAELAQAEAQRHQLLVETNAQANQLIQEAHASAERVRERETQRAIAGAEEILAKARDAAQREHTRMLGQLKHELGELVVQTTARVTGKVLTPQDQQRIVEETTTQINV